MIKIPKSLLHQTAVFCGGLLDRKAEGPYSFLSVEAKDRYVVVLGIGTLSCSMIKFGIESDETISFICKGEKLDDIINSIDTNDVFISVGEQIQFKGEKVEVCAPIESVQIPRAIETDKLKLVSEKLDIKSFAAALRFVSKASYEGPSDAMSSNIYINNNEIRACDDTRAYCVDYHLGVDLSIPKRNANIIFGFSELVPYGKLYANEDVIKFIGDNGELIIIRGKAPPLPTFEYLIESYQLDNKLYFNRENLILAIKRASVTSNRKQPEIHFKSINRNLYILSEDGGYSTRLLVNDGCQSTVNLRANPKHLLDYLTSLSTETVDIKFGYELDPIFLDSSGYKALIMPLSIADEAEEFKENNDETEEENLPENHDDDDIPF